jgi:hypothetical protein
VSTRRLPWRSGSFSAAAMTLILAACGGSTTTNPPASSAAPSASAASPSIAADDVKAAFLDVIADPKFTGKAAISGSIALAGINGEVSGEWVFNGRDNHMTMTVSVPGNETTNESITIGPDGWDRSGEGPWLEREAAAGAKKSLTSTLAVLSSLEDRGVESKDGVDLHHFQPANGGVIPADALGIDNPDVKDPKAVADFYVTADGVPELFEFHLTWTQAISGQDTAVTMEMAMDLEEVGEAQTIDPPAEDQIWTRYKSTFGYTMAHPPAWTVKHAKSEDSYLLDGQAYVYVAPQSLPSGEKLSSFLAGLITFYKHQFGTEPDSRESTAIGGSPAFRLVYHFKNEADQDVALVDVGTVHAGKGWEIFILTLAGGTEAEDIAVFDDFVTTFKFTK